jgi:hypothetical protein
MCKSTSYRVRDGRERLKAHLWCEERDLPRNEPQDDICEVCGYEDASVEHGICADCRQGQTQV